MFCVFRIQMSLANTPKSYSGWIITEATLNNSWPLLSFIVECSPIITFNFSGLSTLPIQQFPAVNTVLSPFVYKLFRRSNEEKNTYNCSTTEEWFVGIESCYPWPWRWFGVIRSNWSFIIGQCLFLVWSIHILMLFGIVEQVRYILNLFGMVQVRYFLNLFGMVEQVWYIWNKFGTVEQVRSILNKFGTVCNCQRQVKPRTNQIFWNWAKINWTCAFDCGCFVVANSAQTVHMAPVTIIIPKAGEMITFWFVVTPDFDFTS